MLNCKQPPLGGSGLCAGSRVGARKWQGGVVIIEALLALLIFSLGVLAIVGLQGTMMRDTTAAKFRMDASMLASERVGRMWVDIANVPSYAETETTITQLPGGKRTTVVTGDAAAGYVVTVTYTWQMPGASDTQQYLMRANINPNPI